MIGAKVKGEGFVLIRSRRLFNNTEDFRRMEANNQNENITEKAAVKTPSALASFFDLVETCITAAVIAVLILFFIAKVGTVVGTSMLSTMEPGDRYVLTSLFYTPKQGDIVVFSPNEDDANGEKLWVKRIIATEGQTVEIKSGEVYVDGEKLDEYYLDEDIYTEPKLYGEKTVVPDGCVFVMGDNRPVSKDSRYIGPVSVESIVGKVFFRFWPLNKIGTVEQ